MKKHYYSVILLLFIAQSSFSQNTLQYGQSDPGTMIAPPYFYWDALRVEGYNWIREKRELETDPWENYLKTETQKEGSGKFTLLQNSTWGTGSQAWNIDHRFKYMFTRDANGKLLEVVDDQYSPLGIYGRKWTFEYDQGYVTKTITKLKSGGNYTDYLERFYFYDNGLRVKDSVIYYNGTAFEPDSRITYKYDGNNRCTNRVVSWANQSGGWDTMQVQIYDYTTGGSIKLAEYYIAATQGDPVLPQTRYIYTFTSSGKIQDVLVSYSEAGSPVFKEFPSSHYKHYYNTQDKLTAMVMLGRLNTGVWRTEDSVSFSLLTNGHLDTGYQYVISGGALKSYPTSRLTFENTHTGINRVTMPVTGLAAYPNPVRDVLTVSMETANSGNYLFTLTDITGKLLRTIEALGLSAGKEQIQVNMDGLPAGIYLLNCGNEILKISKQ